MRRGKSKKKIDEVKLRAAADRWLAAKQCTLWADWEITKEDRRTLAIDFIVNTITGVLAEME